MSAAPKTKPTLASVRAFLERQDDARRIDCVVLIKLMRLATGARPVMWGDDLVGFGRYRYEYASGRTGEWPLTGFAPRKRELTIYVVTGFSEYGPLLEKLGKHKHAKSCLYVRSLADVDLGVLRRLVERSVADVRAKYPATREPL